VNLAADILLELLEQTAGPALAPLPRSAAGTEVPLWAPVYGTDFRVATSRFWKKYATFSGRASRSEYWWAMLFVGITGAVVDELRDLTAPDGGELPHH